MGLELVIAGMLWTTPSILGAGAGFTAFMTLVGADGRPDQAKYTGVSDRPVSEMNRFLNDFTTFNVA